MTTPITIEEINQHIQCCDKCSCAILRRLRDALVSGEYALVSKADRELAIQLVSRFARSGNEHQLAKARELLNVDPFTFAPNHVCMFCTRTETPE